MAKNIGTTQVNEETGEIVNGYSFNPAAVKAKKILNLPVLSQKGTGSVYAVLISKMFIGKEIAGDDKGGKDGKKKDPATIAYAVDMMTGKPCQLIMSTVQAGVLRECYPDDSYVGKGFHFENLGKLNGKDYNSVNVNEIDIPDGLDIEAVKALVTIPS